MSDVECQVPHVTCHMLPEVLQYIYIIVWQKKPLDHVNQMCVEENKLLRRLTPLLLICALCLGKHNFFYDFLQMGQISGGNKTNKQKTLE